MTIFRFDWQLIAYVALAVMVALRAWGFRRQLSSGVLDYGYNRVDRAVDPKRFRFWFIADLTVFAMIVLGAANWIGQQ